MYVDYTPFSLCKFNLALNKTIIYAPCLNASGSVICKQLSKLHLQKEKHVEHFGMRGHLSSIKPSPQQEHANKSGEAAK